MIIILTYGDRKMKKQCIFKPKSESTLEQNLELAKKLIGLVKKEVISSHDIIPFEELMKIGKLSEMHKCPNDIQYLILSEIHFKLNALKKHEQLSEDDNKKILALENYLKYCKKLNIIRKATEEILKDNRQYNNPLTLKQIAPTHYHVGECGELATWICVKFVTEYNRTDITLIMLSQLNKLNVNHSVLLIGPHSIDTFPNTNNPNKKIDFSNFDPRCVIIDPLLGVCCSVIEFSSTENKIKQYLKKLNIKKIKLVTTATSGNLNLKLDSFNDLTAKLERKLIFDALISAAPNSGPWSYNQVKQFAWTDSYDSNILNIIKKQLRETHKQILEEDILISKNKPNSQSLYKPNSQLYTLVIRNITFNKTFDPLPFSPPNALQTSTNTTSPQ
jgi:hypothetical protein